MLVLHSSSLAHIILQCSSSQSSAPPLPWLDKYIRLTYVSKVLKLGYLAIAKDVFRSLDTERHHLCHKKIVIVIVIISIVIISSVFSMIFWILLQLKLGYLEQVGKMCLKMS